jgi:hypothetical protein
MRILVQLLPLLLASTMVYPKPNDSDNYDQLVCAFPTGDLGVWICEDTKTGKNLKVVCEAPRDKLGDMIKKMPKRISGTELKKLCGIIAEGNTTTIIAEGNTTTF